MYTYIFMCLHCYTRVSIHGYICIYKQIWMNIYKSIEGYTPLLACVCVSIYIQTNIYEYIDMLMCLNTERYIEG